MENIAWEGRVASAQPLLWCSKNVRAVLVEREKLPRVLPCIWRVVPAVEGVGGGEGASDTFSRPTAVPTSKLHSHLRVSAQCAPGGFLYLAYKHRLAGRPGGPVGILVTF